MRKLLSLLLLCATLVACASVPREAPRAGDAAPLLRLAPEALGRELFLQQRLTVHAGGRVQSIDVMLEADAEAVRLAVLSLGQTAARLEWDGAELRESQADWWPQAVRGERILNDLQLVLWPEEAIRAVLPAGWTLDAAATQRTLRQAGEAVVSVVYVSASRAELVHERDGYRIVIDSVRAGEGS